MGEIVVPFGLLERLLPSFDHDKFARTLAPVLDAGDVRSATRMWLEWRERADRVLRRKKVTKEVREKLLSELSSAVRIGLLIHRAPPSTMQEGRKGRQASPKASAAVIPFRLGGAA